MVSSLLGPKFHAEPPTLSDIKMSSIVWGTTLGIGLLTAWKAIEQTIGIWRRNKALHSSYLWMVWLLWMDNMAQGAVCWCFMSGLIPPGYTVTASLSLNDANLLQASQSFSL